MSIEPRQAHPDSAPISWEGNTYSYLKNECPAEIKHDLGADLRRLQLGEEPSDWAPAGLPGTFELRASDRGHWYRLIYKRIGGTIYVLHVFIKKTNKTSLQDLNTARLRLNEVERRLREIARVKKHEGKK